jgi:hypothetical protein
MKALVGLAFILEQDMAGYDNSPMKAESWENFYHCTICTSFTVARSKYIMQAV